VEGVALSSAVFPADKLADLLTEAGRMLAGQDYYALARFFVAQFRQAKVGITNVDFGGVGAIGAWLALNHPAGGRQMRSVVLVALRQDGKAHVTVCFSGGHLAIALAEKFVDLEKLTAAAQGRLWSCLSGTLRFSSERT
jgi:hypothetical protein